MEFSIWQLVMAYVIDLIIGDPKWMPHPVRWIGSIISFLETRLHPPSVSFYHKPWMTIIKGGILVVITVSVVLGAYRIIVAMLPRGLEEIFVVWLTFTLIATNSLHKETSLVVDALEMEDIDEARRKLSWLVSRDTENLDKEAILKATVETLSENISDGIIAPLFYIGLGGPVLGLFYKTINTLDSMVGYKNERYLYFGKIAARLDDILNYIPARISGILIVISALIIERWHKPISWRRGFEIMQRDGRLLASPNAGIPQAAMAGVLGVTLGGRASYFGKIIEKPVMGDPVNPLTIISYRIAVIILYLSSITGLIISVILRLL